MFNEWWDFIGESARWIGRSAPDIAINLIAAGLGGAAVWIMTRASRRARLIRARRFWKVTIQVGLL